MHTGTGLKIVLLLMLLTVAAAAVQPVYRVAPDIIFLPLDGVALNAHTGHVVWRFPRYTGQTYTDGHGLLLLSWTVAIAPYFHHRTTRICRLRARDGHQLWCRDHAALRQWVVDNTGRYIYLHTPARLEILNAADGRPDHGYDLDDDDELRLMPLPSTGVLMLQRHRGNVVKAWQYTLGDPSLEPVAVPGALYPFRGNGRGLLLYVRAKHEFFLAAPLRRLFHRRDAPTVDAFPVARLDDSGFVFTDWVGHQAVVRGGTYTGALWQARRRDSPPQLALTQQTAIMLESANGGAHQLVGWDLAHGDRRYTCTISAAAGRDLRLHAGDGAVLLQSDAGLQLYDASSGVERWHVRRHAGTLAAIARTAIVFWSGGGQMVGLARNDGALLWRVRFRTVGVALPF
ncbi:MAG: PQQ-binding-like beta-propeller repeat protein [Terriglobales bacterium]